MFHAKRTFVKKSKTGTAKIVREGYTTATTGWWTIRNEVFKRDNGKCQVRVNGHICGEKATDVHHIIALSRGGTTTKSNLISICDDHHKRRHNHMARR
jgi:5-methylcytosine-specific restriction endonuclease McrA